MKGSEVLNLMRKTDTHPESSIESAACTQIFKQKQQMTRITTYLSFLTLDVNGLNFPSKHIIWKNG
jgi:hypothetical protein